MGHFVSSFINISHACTNFVIIYDTSFLKKMLCSDNFQAETVRCCTLTFKPYPYIRVNLILSAKLKDQEGSQVMSSFEVPFDTPQIYSILPTWQKGVFLCCSTEKKELGLFPYWKQK
jgi:hypothetical protein